MAKKLPQYAQTAPVLFKWLIAMKNSADLLLFAVIIACQPMGLLNSIGNSSNIGIWE